VSNSARKMPARLKLYGQSIPFSKTAKYLGVTLDDKLSWKPHIENKIKKAKRSLMAVRSVKRADLGPLPGMCQMVMDECTVKTSKSNLEVKHDFVRLKSC
jgi:hypothetical protein